MLEWWHADRHAVFSGFGRVGTAVDGAYTFTAVRPGRVQYHGNVLQAPHISLAIFARGLLNHLFTRIYLPNEPSNADDPILLRVPADRRSTLIASQDSSGVSDGAQAYRFDVVLQGAGETVFFDFK
jgi:protocatechuate 3,4-dioxygenase alpha subunit